MTQYKAPHDLTLPPRQPPFRPSLTPEDPSHGPSLALPLLREACPRALSEAAPPSPSLTDPVHFHPTLVQLQLYIHEGFYCFVLCLYF